MADANVGSIIATLRVDSADGSAVCRLRRPSFPSQQSVGRVPPALQQVQQGMAGIATATGQMGQQMQAATRATSGWSRRSRLRVVLGWPPEPGRWRAPWWRLAAKPCRSVPASNNCGPHFRRLPAVPPQASNNFSSSRPRRSSSGRAGTHCPWLADPHRCGNPGRSPAGRSATALHCACQRRPARWCDE